MSDAGAPSGPDRSVAPVTKREKDLAASARDGAIERPYDGATEVIPLVEERLVVSKRLVEREGVRVRVITDEVAELARVSLRSERIEIERVPIDRQVERAPDVREEDGVTVIPVLEEVVVVEKRLVLKEELRVRRVADTREEEQPVTLRRQRAEVERLPPSAADRQPGATPSNPEDKIVGEQA